MLLTQFQDKRLTFVAQGRFINTMDDTFKEFIKSSYNLLSNNPHKGRYYHTLTPLDNSQIVVHKETNQLTIVISGSGKAVLDGNETLLNKDDYIFIEAGTKHQFSALGSELVLFHIHIPDEGRDNDRFIISGDDYDRYTK